MPKSRKRVKKEKVEQDVIVRNPVKTPLGKAVIILLASGFLLSVVIGLGVILYEIATR